MRNILCTCGLILPFYPSPFLQSRKRVSHHTHRVRSVVVVVGESSKAQVAFPRRRLRRQPLCLRFCKCSLSRRRRRRNVGAVLCTVGGKPSLSLALMVFPLLLLLLPHLIRQQQQPRVVMVEGERRRRRRGHTRRPGVKNVDVRIMLEARVLVRAPIFVRMYVDSKVRSKYVRSHSI